MELKEIVKESKKLENQKSAINDVKTLFETREKVIQMFDDYSRILSQAKYKTKNEEGKNSQTIALKNTNST